jgi:hypothetical protein
MTAVVDFARMNRLRVPEDPNAMSLMTKVYIVIIAIACVFLIKRYRDIRRRSSEPF